jgi:hypothetical protein
MTESNSNVNSPVDAQLLTREHRLIRTENFRPGNAGEILAPFLTDASLPSTLDELDESNTRAYDLTVSAASALQIPVAGSASGGFNRRVIVLERASFRKIFTDDIERQYGYAIRLCVTVNRWQADTKVSLPFLAASAQLGVIEAQWILQVIGLSGKEIDAAILPPTELNVDTFVIAKQSLEKIISALRDPATKFQARLIAEIHPPDAEQRELRSSVARAYALSSIERGRSLQEAKDHLGSDDPLVQDALITVYEKFAGLTNPSDSPSAEVRRKATEVSGRLKTDIPWFG